MAELTFLRPHWLMLLPVVLVLVGWLWQRAGRTSPWRAHGDPALMRHALIRLTGKGGLGWSAAMLGAALSIVAMAGPSWERGLTHAMRPAHTRIVVLDLSRSMDAEDVAPSRLGVAVEKTRAILKRSQGLQIGLAVFAGASFAVAPLTSDAATVVHHLDVMHTSLMPVQGSRPDLGLKEAARLLELGGALSGEVILISDGYRGKRAAAQAARLLAKGFPVSVIAVGTERASTIPVRFGTAGPHAAADPLRALSGEIVKVPAFVDELKAIARSGGGRFATGNDDVDAVLGGNELWARSVDDPDRRLSVPAEGGPWLVLLVLPLAALAFRRGWLLVLPLGIALTPPAAQAGWDEWFKSSDHRAAKALAEGDPRSAVRMGRDPMIVGAAFFRLENYPLAAAAFAQSANAIGHYNRGNALAHMGKIAQALAAYDQALALDPGLVDARFNQAILAPLLPPQGSEGKRRSERALAPELEPPPSDLSQTPPGPATAPLAERSERPSDPEPAGAGAGASAPTLPGAAREFAPPGEDETLDRRRADQWLARISEDPARLLRQKFRLEFEKRRWQRSQNTDSW